MDKDLTLKFEAKAFSCPYCGVYARQNWKSHSYDRCCYGIVHTDDRTRWMFSAQCESCGRMSIWYEGKLIYPVTVMVASPNPDLNQDIIDDYNEAALILQTSPRGAAALLRLATQKLCVQLGCAGKNLNEDIASLVKKGLSSQIQKSLDALRVIGNNAVHPGELDVRDTPQIAVALFKLINKIADTMITDVKEIDLIYESLPEEQKSAIKKRDGNKGKD